MVKGEEWEVYVAILRYRHWAMVVQRYSHFTDPGMRGNMRAFNDPDAIISFLN